MGHSKIVINRVIHNETGAIEHICTSEDGDKYFAVIAKCGHVGQGYFMPVCFAVRAKDMESAIKLTKERSRVQRDHKDCILGITEVSAVEYYLIHYQNDHDAYIKTNYANEEIEHIERRRIMSQELLQDVIDQHEYRTGKNGYKKKTPVAKEIKTADKYLDYQTLQKAFAPRLYGKKYVYPKKVDARTLVDAYLSEIAVLQGILKKRAHPLILYYEIFGEGNELGLTYKNGELSYRSLNGNTVLVPVTDGEREHIENSEFVRAKKEEKKEEYVIDETTELPSALEKFNRRFQKYQQLAGKSEQAESQPGE